MKYEDLKPGLPVRIAPDHTSGYGGRGGIVLDVGTFHLISEPWLWGFVDHVMIVSFPMFWEH
ncbi:hypothetical protein G8C92_27010 [Paenibacillus donghaensis]|uniref:hypothetical protein n=1 Tax=Paenibacillus donghaensis TaxID=414771 RepID=UPI0018838788|nr:hypothetical protein [Paenibacillus donghaensis]MBE9917671.1 hypothetical protein [Paenibacillus donghaensis]